MSLIYKILQKQNKKHKKYLQNYCVLNFLRLAWVLMFWMIGYPVSVFWLRYYAFLWIIGYFDFVLHNDNVPYFILCLVPNISCVWLLHSVYWPFGLLYRLFRRYRRIPKRTWARITRIFKTPWSKIMFFRGVNISCFIKSNKTHNTTKKIKKINNTDPCQRKEQQKQNKKHKKYLQNYCVLNLINQVCYNLIENMMPNEWVGQSFHLIAIWWNVIDI
jgi:hypothetical protein